MAGEQPAPHIYLDCNATTPYASEVIDCITESMKYDWSNASSTHSLGLSAKEAISRARWQVCKMISADSDSEIIFTSGGTESNATILYMLSPGSHVITSTIEHDSIIEPLKELQQRGALHVTYVKPKPGEYCIDPTDVIEAITPDTKLITIMLANNETGVIQDVKTIAHKVLEYNKLHNRHILVHTDAAQAIGKIPVSVKDLQVDYLTLVGHKFYGPRIGALYVRDGSPFGALFYGGKQERSRRAGTENTAMICGLGAACELVSKNLEKYSKKMQQTRDLLEKLLKETFNDIVIHGSSQNRLPNTLCLSLPKSLSSLYQTGSEFLKDFPSLIAGTGAACHSNNIKGSRVLVECGVEPDVAVRAVRLSTGRETIKSDVESIADMIKRKLSSFPNGDI